MLKVAGIRYIEKLRDALKHRLPETAAFAAEVLGQIDGEPATIAALGETARSGEPEREEAAIAALAAIFLRTGDPRARKSLSELDYRSRSLRERRLLRKALG